MRILLMNTSGGIGQYRWLSIGLASIIAVLKRAGHSVGLLDFHAHIVQGGSFEQFEALLRLYIQRKKPDLIGMNTNSMEISRVMGFARFIRETYFGLLVAGGHHTTALPRETLRNIPELDYVFCGESEFSLLALADGKNPESIPGVVGRSGNFLPPQQIQRLDDLPFPCYEAYDLSFYTAPNLETIRGFYLRSTSVLSARGCAYACSFCCESLTFGHGVRFHSAEYILELLKKLIVDYRLNGIYFQDNDFLIDPQRATTICGLIRAHSLEKQIRWGIQTRADRVLPEIIRELRASGCVKIEIGLESGIQNELDGFHKQNLVESNHRALQICAQNGISVHGNFLTRTQDETLQTMKSKLHWIRNHRIDTFQWVNLLIHPGTLLYHQKGNQFFEKNPWTESCILEFFRKDILSSVPPQDRKRWTKKHVKPLMIARYRFTVLKKNSIFLIPSILWHRFLRNLHGKP